MNWRIIYPLFILALFFSSCMGPRSTINSGKVLPKNHIRAGLNNCFNISTTPVFASSGSPHFIGPSSSNNDTVYFDNTITDINRFVVAYSLDPITFNSEFFMRAGVGRGLDAGYRYSGGHAFDAMFQFLGSHGDFVSSHEGGMYGSIGLQYSWQNFQTVYSSAFKEFQSAFGYRFFKQDLTVPIIFSHSFGPEERYGCFSFGMNYTHHFIRYEVSPRGIYYMRNEKTGTAPVLLETVRAKANYGSFGTFVNVKVGYRYIFLTAGLNMYYQNYGNYPLIGGASASFLGFNFVPAFGFQFNAPTKQKMEYREN